MTQEKPRILYVVHCYNNKAGVEEHTKALELSLQSDFDVYVVYPEEGKVWLRKNMKTIAELPGEAAPWPVCPYELPTLQESLKKVLHKVQPDLIHIQHFINWHLGVLDQLSAVGKPTLLSFHEYFAITPHFTMQFIKHPLQAYSRDYSEKVFGSDISEYLKQRRLVLIASFCKMSRLIVPSKFLALELSKVFPWEYSIIEHGISPFTPEPVTPCSSLRFGYLGSLIQQKGWQTALEAFKKIHSKHPETELHFFGGGENIPDSPPSGVFFHGRYSGEDLGTITSQFDIGIVPSTFKETYCYVLSEMQWAGKPVAASNLGALADRVIEGKTGKKFRAGDSDDLSNALLWFLEHNEWREWQIPRPRALREMIAEYKELYCELLGL